MKGYERKNPLHVVKRLELDERERKSSQALIEGHIRAHSREVARELGIEGVSFQRAEVDVGALRKSVAALASLLQVNPQRVLDYKLHSELQFLAPPYDESWSVGAGAPLSAWDGASYVFGSNGFSASGFGVVLTSDRHVSVSIMPQGTFTAGWANFTSDPPLYSSGGAGAVVYCDGDLLLSRKPRVWTVRDPAEYTNATFDMSFASTATPPWPGSFGPDPLAPIIFDMLPGKRYLVWFYVWQLNQAIAGKSFLVFVNASVPLIALHTADPLFLH